jgi:hypothetical protein
MRITGICLAVAGSIGLAACGGGGDDDGPGGLNGGTQDTFDILQSDFDALLSDYDRVAPTPPAGMPIGGTATYAGAAVYSNVATDPNVIIANPTSASKEHARHHLVGRAVAVGEGLDVDDHLLAHLDPPLQRGRAHVRQQHHVRQLAQARVDVVAALEHRAPRRPVRPRAAPGSARSRRSPRRARCSRSPPRASSASAAARSADGRSTACAGS